MNISGIKKSVVLAALYNKAKVQGMGIFQAVSGDMTQEEAQAILDQSPDKYFDYLKGRVMKIDLSADEIDPWLYNRDNGENAAENIIAKLKS